MLGETSLTPQPHHASQGSENGAGQDRGGDPCDERWVRHLVRIGAAWFTTHTMADHKGSSRQAIAKYLKSEFDVDNATSLKGRRTFTQ